VIEDKRQNNLKGNRALTLFFALALVVVVCAIDIDKPLRTLILEMILPVHDTMC
jgi:hypothetical protein